MSKSHPEHIVVTLTGLGDHVGGLDWAMKEWPAQGLHPLIQSLDWYNPNISYQEHLAELLGLMSHLIDNHHLVSILGTSAGGSLAVNLFREAMVAELPVHKAVAVCSRLVVGATDGYRSYHAKTKASPLFATSVLELEHNLPLLQNRENIMTVRPWWDELVPAGANVIEGAHNILIPMLEHGVSILAALKLPVFSHYMIDFLNQGDKNI